MSLERAPDGFGLRERSDVRDWLEGAVIRFEVPAEEARPDTVYVGSEPPAMTAGLNRVAGGAALVLTNKGVPYRAVARFVAAAPDLDAWRSAMRLLTDGERPFAGKTVVVEDASPDTCLALVTLARRLAGLPIDEPWLDFAERWEGGDTTSTGAPAGSWGALHNALVHGLIDPATQDKADIVTPALVAGCRLAEGLMVAGVRPDAVPAAGTLAPPLSALVIGARAALAVVRDVARTAVATSRVVQLDVPIAALPRRRRTIDAVIVVDRAVVDAKSILRRDTTSPSGEGFAFLALNRPSERGTGNDITFSVDPESGVWLRDLWIELERLEWERWTVSGEPRPETPPRPLASFEPRGDGPLLGRPCVQPWYDANGSYTLVAAPRDLPDGRPGSKLTWEDALGAVWRLYAPVNALRLRARSSGEEVDFFSNPPEFGGARVPAPKCPSLWVSHLARPPDGADAAWTETIARTCAAFLTNGRSAIDQLPLPREFDVVAGRGGYALVSSAGAMTVEIAPGAGFPFEELLSAIDRAAETLHAAMRLEERIADARRTGVEAVQGGSSRAKTAALVDLYGVLIEALERGAHPPPRPEDPFVAELTDALEARWRPAERFRAVVEEASEVRDMVVASSDVRANEMIGAIAVYGFPFAALVNFFAFAFANDQGNMLRGWTVGGLEVWPFLAWLGTSLALAFALHLLARRRDRSWREQMLRRLDPR
jgi:hypothetical protein